MRQEIRDYFERFSHSWLDERYGEITLGGILGGVLVFPVTLIVYIFHRIYNLAILPKKD